MEVIKDESYYKSLDKRTKEYKEYKASFKDKTEIKIFFSMSFNFSFSQKQHEGWKYSEIHV